MDLRRAIGGVLVLLGALGIVVAVAVSLVGAWHAAQAGEWASVALAPLGLALGVALPLVLVLVGRRIVRNEPPAGPPRARPVAPVPTPDVDEASALRYPLTACPDCGFVGVRMPELKDALFPGGGELGDRKVCPRCGFQGLAPRFDGPAEYVAFVRGLHGA